MKSVIVATVAAVLAAAAATLAPPAQALLLPGNYDVLTDRYTQASWFWFVTPCLPDKKPDCVHVDAAPRLKFYDYYDGNAPLVNNRYTLAVDVNDGLRCPGYNLPTHDIYSWDANTQAGTIESTYEVGCFNGPPGTQSWTFSLTRL